MSFWFSSALLLLFYYAALSDAQQPAWLSKIEEDKEYNNVADKFEERKPFARRKIGQTTIWMTPKGKSFAVHFIPREHCQEVWICSTPWGDTKPVPKKLLSYSDSVKLCNDLHVFRPLEQSVELAVRYHDDGMYSEVRRPSSPKANFPWAKAVFVNEGRSTALYDFKLDVADEDRDTQGGVTKKETKSVKLNGWPLIITSSPYCKIEVHADTPSGKPLNFIDISPELPEFPIWNMQNDAENAKKTFNGLLVRTGVKKYEKSTKSQCPPLWKPEFEKIKDKWVTTRSSMIPESVYFNYELKRNADCKLGTAADEPVDGTPFVPASETERASIKLHIENPEECNWVRICFLEDETKSQMCMNPEKSIELMIVYKLFVGVDSDEARRLDVPANELTHFRFELTRNRNKADQKSTNDYRLTMGYSFANDYPGVEYHMYADAQKWEKWLSGGQRVSLIRDKFCMARLVTDFQFQADNKKGKQCLTVAKCDVAVATEMQDSTPAKEYTETLIKGDSSNIKN